MLKKTVQLLATIQCSYYTLIKFCGYFFSYHFFNVYFVLAVFREYIHRTLNWERRELSASDLGPSENQASYDVSHNTFKTRNRKRAWVTRT